MPSLQKIHCYTNVEIVIDKFLEYNFYNKMKSLFPQDYDYMPETYAYPEQKDIINEKFKNYNLAIGNLWLIKPKLMSLGDGIHIFHNFTNLNDDYIITKY